MRQPIDMEEKRMAYVPMTLQEKLAMSMKGHELKAAGKTTEAVWRRIPVPPYLAKAVKESARVEVASADAGIPLGDMLARITPENIHGEIAAGGAVGREAW